MREKRLTSHRELFQIIYLHIPPSARQRKPFSFKRILMYRNSLAVQCLGLCAFTVKGLGSIPGQGTKIPQAKAWLKKTIIIINK